MKMIIINNKQELYNSEEGMFTRKSNWYCRF